ncbi:MAG: hypothetical protein OZ921_16735 [Sorangiineae bacterium]|nr:hypothetical protein [Polyangiaceae bacterium]MEB2324161.1 hypothetical protein [Sorangiineae bacterium]
MKKNAWAMMAALGFAASLVVAGCTVTTTDGNTDGGAGSGNTGNTGNTGGTAGSGTGGTAGNSTGGTAGSSTGGTGGSSAECNPTDPTNSTCDTCVQTNCCEQWKKCTDDCATELPCIQDCIFNLVSDGGVADDAALATCAGQCAKDASGVIADTTNELISCMNDETVATNCRAECFQQ